ncbi:hypothetical protein CANTEDRAFT_116390 [Yamadazyma tenuis ATCC 10573]|uniref:Uncharacterized protein n=1 Tax=Candida tenuis (strain ATCC 10573 / BCRC 21748 / CBS 615 / JCM 9827 / NBRC 10315 / NRRL Y-1498 / VKM Y-70) TaxID=590646 RepID=G3BDM9_CANTC|nr:uncharacterized protein CANTEDRAFT_116390 [Yamadazyma tenuis ATCC 10573]EGV60344.1 hypothetical protein CANTEDRAFT_116390 [Yamadazyma tenuis ATCC 10573]
MNTDSEAISPSRHKRLGTSEFQSPTKPLHSIFRRQNSFDSADSSTSFGSNRRSISPIRKSLSNSLYNPTSPSRLSTTAGKLRNLVPMLSGSRSSVHTDVSQITSLTSQLFQPVQDDSTSIRDFADTSGDDDDDSGSKYSASVESILQEYTDDSPKKKFFFNEHFDEKSLASVKRNISTKSVIERTLNETRSDFEGTSGSHNSSVGRSSKDFAIFHDASGFIGSSSSNRSSSANPAANKHMTALSSIDNNTSSSSSRNKIYYDTTTYDNLNETSERPLFEQKSFINSRTSLNSGELLSKLNRSLSDVADRHVHPSRAVVAYRVKNSQSPKLIQIPNPEPAHYHDSDISSENSIGSITVPTTRGIVSKAPKFGSAYLGSARRPPPQAPVQDSLYKYNQHEDMYQSQTTKTVVDGFPAIGTAQSNVTSPDYTDYDESYFGNLEEKQSQEYVAPQHFSWSYFVLLMGIGLILPPIYFLVSLGIFDKLKSSKNYYNGIYYQQQLSVNRGRVVKFSPRQKLVSFFVGILWFSIVLGMIGVGFGLTQ